MPHRAIDLRTLVAALAGNALSTRLNLTHVELEGVITREETTAMGGY